MVGSVHFFLFFPKMKTLRSEAADGPLEPKVRLTGLHQSHAAVTDSRGKDSEGELILTTKGTRELLDDIYQLQQQLQLAEQENTRLMEKIRRCCGDDDIEAHDAFAYTAETSAPDPETGMI
jgi:hypothetical protein